MPVHAAKQAKAGVWTRSSDPYRHNTLPPSATQLSATADIKNYRNKSLPGRAHPTARRSYNLS